MAHYENVLKDGGKVLLVGGSTMGQYPQDLINSERVLIWTDDILKDGQFRAIPEAVKAVAISRANSHAKAHMILKQARERKLLIVPGFGSITNISKIAREMLKNNPVEVKVASSLDEDAIETELKAEDTVERKDGKKIAGRGVIKQFVIQHANLRNSAAEEGRRLFDLAKQYGITTTIASLQQAVSNRKRDLGAGDIPASVSKARAQEAPHKTLLRDVDNAIAAFQLLREHVENIVKENEELRKFKSDFQKKMKDLFGGDI